MGIAWELSINLNAEADLCFWTYKRWWGRSEFPRESKVMSQGGKGMGLGKGCRK